MRTKHYAHRALPYETNGVSHNGRLTTDSAEWQLVLDLEQSADGIFVVNALDGLGEKERR